MYGSVFVFRYELELNCIRGSYNQSISISTNQPTNQPTKQPANKLTILQFIITQKPDVQRI